MKKFFKYLFILIILSTPFSYVLINRDLQKIYGGLTELADTTSLSPISDSMVINNINVLNPAGDNFLAGQYVYIDTGQITAITPTPQAVDGRYEIDGTGRFLIPGLVDAHVHMFKSPNDLLLYVANGVTQVRELIGEPDHLAWRNQVEQGGIGPDLFITSPRIGSFGVLEGAFMEWSQGYANLSDANEAESAVQEYYDMGYDGIKIYSQINRESYTAAAQKARQLDMKVVGHVPWNLELKDIYGVHHGVGHLEELMNALNREFGGYSSDTTDKFLQFVKQRGPQMAQDLKIHNITVTTTLWLVESFVRQKVNLDAVLSEVSLAHQNPGISEWSSLTPRGLGWLPGVNRYEWADDWDNARRARSEIYWRTYAEACQVILKQLYQADVVIMAGTDANLPPAVPGFSLHDELISMQRAGMSPEDVLRSATSTPAQWLNNESGILAAGKKANLVLLSANPLLDIKHTKNIEAVLMRGEFYDRNLLDQLLAAVADANDVSRSVDISVYID